MKYIFQVALSEVFSPELAILADPFLRDFLDSFEIALGLEVAGSLFSLWVFVSPPPGGGPNPFARRPLP